VNVLLAEDDMLTRAAVEGALREWGFEVACCDDGLAAWDRLRAPGGPRLALLDWLMPGYTHLQRAQPVYLSHHLLAYVWMLVRGRRRLHAVVAATALGASSSASSVITAVPLTRNVSPTPGIRNSRAIRGSASRFESWADMLVLYA